MQTEFHKLEKMLELCIIHNGSDCLKQLNHDILLKARDSAFIYHPFHLTGQLPQLIISSAMGDLLVAAVIVITNLQLL